MRMKEEDPLGRKTKSGQKSKHLKKATITILLKLKNKLKETKLLACVGKMESKYGKSSTGYMKSMARMIQRLDRKMLFTKFVMR